MAQTIDDLKNEMLTEKAAHVELDALNSESNTAIWRLWMYITAVLIILFEEIIDLSKRDIQTIIDSNDYGTDPWWYEKIKAYQHGDLLVFQNNVYVYPAIDATKQIVKFCSITSLGGIVQIKTAGASGTQPTVLNDDQLNGLLSYCKQIRPSGIRYTVQSLQADNIKFLGNIYYNASADITVVKPAVIAAINNYLENLNTSTDTNRNFDGTFYINKMVDAVQSVVGVVGNQFDVLQVAAKSGSDAYAIFTSSYPPKSGYFMIDPDFDLNTTLIFIAS